MPKSKSKRESVLKAEKVKDNKKVSKSAKDEYIENQQKAFIREVNDDLEYKKLTEFWNKWKNVIFASVAIIISLSIINQVYSTWKERTSVRETNELLRISELFNKKKTNDALLALEELTKTARFATRDLAYINLYSFYYDDKNMEKVVNILEDMMENAYDSAYKSYAKVHLAYIKSEKMNFDQLNDFLRSDLESSNFAFKFSGYYLLALKALDENNFKELEEILTSIDELGEAVPTGYRAHFANMQIHLKHKKDLEKSKK